MLFVFPVLYLFIFLDYLIFGRKQQNCSCHKVFRIKGRSAACAPRWLIRTLLMTWLGIQTQRKKIKAPRELGAGVPIHSSS